VWSMLKRLFCWKQESSVLFYVGFWRMFRLFVQQAFLLLAFLLSAYVFTSAKIFAANEDNGSAALADESQTEVTGEKDVVDEDTPEEVTKKGLLNPEWVTDGREVVQKLYSKDYIKYLNSMREKTSQYYLQKIVELMHYFCSKIPAKNQGKFFLFGTITFEDPDWRVYTFLRNYVASVCKDLKTEKAVASTVAYPRKSTHFNDYYKHIGVATQNGAKVTKNDDNYIHYGIDIDVKKGQTLPIYKKQHILFGRVGEINGKKITFVKFETAGLQGAGQAIKHLGQLIKAKVVGKKPPQHPETDLRREDIPKEISGEYIKILALSGIAKLLTGDDAVKYKQDAKVGVHAIAAAAQDKVFKDTRLETFGNMLRKKYSDWMYRIGNEIIFLQKDLVSK
jgi:hypothetical protein